MHRRTLSATLSATLLLTLGACTGGDPGDTDAGSSGTAPGTTDMSDPPGSTTDAPTTDAQTDPTTTAPDPTGDPDETDTGGDPAIPLDAPCEFGPAAPTRLAVVTNNFIDPASVHVVDVATRQIAADIAPATSDPALAWGDGKLVVIGRYGFDSLEVLDGDDWQALSTLEVQVDGVAEANPQALAFAADGRAYLTLMNSAIVPVHDFDLPPGETQVASLDLGAFADADGSPESGVAVACGGVLFVGIQRLEMFVPVDASCLVPIDLATGAPIDVDPAVDGPQAIALLGPWPKQLRADPTDPAGHTALVLTSGVERVDLARGTSEWVVRPETLAALDIDGFDVQSFAPSADGAGVYLVATAGDFPNSALYWLADDAPPVEIAADLTTREKVLERFGDELWVGDDAEGQQALRIFDLTADPPAELPPLALPGAPYLTLALP